MVILPGGISVHSEMPCRFLVMQFAADSVDIDISTLAPPSASIQASASRAMPLTLFSLRWLYIIIFLISILSETRLRERRLSDQSVSRFLPILLWFLCMPAMLYCSVGPQFDTGQMAVIFPATLVISQLDTGRC